MSTSTFNRSEMAAWYAEQHLKTDPGVQAVLYLPTNAPEREVRFIEINHLLGERTDDSLQPIDFGVETEEESSHRLLVLDVTPQQWERIVKQTLCLPAGWSLDGAVRFE